MQTKVKCICIHTQYKYLVQYELKLPACEKFLLLISVLYTKYYLKVKSI